MPWFEADSPQQEARPFGQRESQSHTPWNRLLLDANIIKPSGGPQSFHVTGDPVCFKLIASFGLELQGTLGTVNCNSVNKGLAVGTRFSGRAQEEPQQSDSQGALESGSSVR
jgi:hypothetical protein